ncbi:MAG: response regulator [Phycisphaerae bacterium]|nr:response regulator [Phycisphaerae bacterium]
MKVLLIDDSRTMRNIQRSVLGQLGYTQIDEAGDGQEGLAKVASYEPELILLDWNMPVMDGMSFLTTLRKQGNKTPVIMVTTEAEKSRVIEAIKAGVNNYLVKPFTPEILAERIKQTMDRLKKPSGAAA